MSEFSGQMARRDSKGQALVGLSMNLWILLILALSSAQNESSFIGSLHAV